jgi:uncharacterized membrane protein YbhN (UPF0104 family)
MSILKAIALALAVFCLGKRLAGSDLRGAVHLISQVGPSAVLALIPFLFAMTLDTLAQRTLLRALGQSVSFGVLYAVRLAAEAASMSLPGGAVFAETVTPALLKQHSGVPYASTVVASAAKRWLTIRAQAGYIALSVAVGFATLAKASPALLGSAALPWLTLGASLVPLVGSWMLGAAILGKDRWRRIVQSFSPLTAYQVGNSLNELGSARGARWRATALLFGGWLLETVDTLVILRLLGAHVGFAEVIAFEAGLALVRSLAFFAPAGLGVQDLGYLAFFGALGLPGAAALGAAFLLMKRAKEALFIIVGGGLFLALRRLERSSTLATEALP